MENKTFYAKYPNINEVSIQTFDDDKTRQKKRRNLAQIFPYSEDIKPQLEKLNNQGAGIFFSVNTMKKGERRIDAVTGVNAWICEMDDFSKEEQQKRIKNAPIKPDVIIESHKSYHLYRLAEDGTKENWKTICRGLQQHFDGDKAVIDISRVLRLPGFDHVKDPDNPFPVNCIRFVDRRHTEEEMMEAYPYEEPKKEKKPPKRKVVSGDNFREVVNQRSASMMLERVSSTFLVDGERIEYEHNSNGTQQIICNGQQTGCWIDTNDTIGSSDGGGPSRVNRVMRYGNVTYSTLYQRIQDNCSDLLPDNLSKLKKEPKRPINLDTVGKVSSYRDYVESIQIAGERGIDGAKDKFGYLYKGDFVVLAGFQYSGKTTLAYHLGEHNANKGRKVMFFTLEMDTKQILNRLALDRTGVSQTELVEEKENHPKFDKIEAEYNKLANLEGYTMLGVENSEDRHIDSIIATIKEGLEKGYTLFIIDSLSHMSGDASEDIKLYHEISRKLRKFCTQTGACVVLIHHMRKPNEKTGLKKPGGRTLIRGSFKLSDDATKVVEYRRNQEDEAEAHIGKILTYKDSLGGMTGTMDVVFEEGKMTPYWYSTTSFEDKTWEEKKKEYEKEGFSYDDM